MKNFFTLLLMSFVVIFFAAANTTIPAFAAGFVFASGHASEVHVNDHVNDIAGDVAMDMAQISEIAQTSEVEQTSEVATMSEAALNEPEENSKTVHQFEMKNITGETISLEQYKGKVVLIVNTASKCGYTPQYEGLQSLYEDYADKGFVILGFPANNFMNQEPGSDEEILTFCQKNYGVTFPMFSKVSVKGDDQDPFFTYLTSQENEDFTGDIRWNFEKFLIDKDGNLVRRFRSGTKPDSKKLLKAIDEYIKS